MQWTRCSDDMDMVREEIMKHTSKRNSFAIGVLVFFITLLCFLPGTQAQGATVAKVGSKRYSSFEKAFNAVGRRGTITLLKNTTLNEQLSLKNNKQITIDLNKHTLATKKNGGFSIENGTVLIKNGTLKDKQKSTYNLLSIYKKGVVTLRNVNYYGEIQIGRFYYARKNGSLTIDGGTFKPSVTDGFMISNFGKLTIKKGTFLNQNTGNKHGMMRTFGTCTIDGGTFKSNVDNSCIIISGEVDGHKAKTTINGGTFESLSESQNSIYCGIVLHECKLTIAGGKVRTGVHIQGGALTMSGGSITNTGRAVWVDTMWGGDVGSFTMKGGSVETKGTVEAIYGDNIKITGGTVTGGGDSYGDYFITYYPVINTSSKTTVKVSGNAILKNRGSSDPIGEQTTKPRTDKKTQ